MLFVISLLRRLLSDSPQREFQMLTLLSSHSPLGLSPAEFAIVKSMFFSNTAKENIMAGLSLFSSSFLRTSLVVSVLL